MCQDIGTGGLWTEKKIHHINVLELRAVFNGIECFTFVSRDTSVELRKDNSSPVSYINHFCGCRSEGFCSVGLKMYISVNQVD